jgi:hypothetical protein
MASTYSALKIELMAVGDQSGTWGITTNTNLGTAIEEAITGSADVTFSSGPETLTLTDTNASQAARNLRLNLTGTSGGAQDLIVPTIEKFYLINNSCADAITVKNATGTGIAVPAGKATLVYNNGTNVVDAVTYLSALTAGTLNLDTALSIANGGTGATDAGTARTNLGLGTIATQAASNVAITGGAINDTTVGASTAASGAFTTLSSSSTATLDTLNLNNALSVVYGGTGLTSLTAGRIPFGAGTSALGNSANLFFDSATTRFGVGTASPAVTMTVVGIDAMLIPKGATGDRPTGVAGYLRFNTSTNEFEGHNGTAWSSVGGSAISNDTATTTDLFPAFLDATTGTAASIFTSNAKLLYKPSTGELKSSQLVATNGIVVNSATVSASYTIPSGSNAMSTGPVVVDTGVTVTVPSGSRYIVL